MPRSAPTSGEAPVNPVPDTSVAWDDLVERRAAGERINLQELAAVDQLQRLTELKARLEAEAAVRRAEAERQVPR